MRFNDSPELFGVGVGSSTYGDIECEWCGAKYNQGEDDRGVYDGDAVTWTEFAGKTVCDCCFEKIENEIWKRHDRVMDWYVKILDDKTEKIVARGKKMEAVLEKRRATQA